MFKGTACVFLNDPPCKDGYVRFTTVPLEPSSDLYCEDIVILLGLKVVNSENSYLL